VDDVSLNGCGQLALIVGTLRYKFADWLLAMPTHDLALADEFYFGLQVENLM